MENGNRPAGQRIESKGSNFCEIKYSKVMLLMYVSIEVLI